MGIPDAEDILYLIGAAYGDHPLADEDQKNGSTFRVEKYCEHLFDGGELLHVIEILQPQYEWTIDNLNYMYYQLVPAERLEELAHGAMPTDEEMALYRIAAEEYVVDHPWLANEARVYRLTAPEGTAEDRPVYFAWYGRENGPPGTGAEIIWWDDGGPFTSLESAAEVIWPVFRQPFMVVKNVDPQVGDEIICLARELKR